MAEKHKRYRSTEKGSRKHREYMREYMTAYRERRKQSDHYVQDILGVKGHQVKWKCPLITGQTP